jgi:hypothetical protein
VPHDLHLMIISCSVAVFSLAISRSKSIPIHYIGAAANSKGSSHV